MIVSLISHKGGCGKSTAAVHLASYLAGKGETVLVDGDANRSATDWANRGELPFQIVAQDAEVEADHIVIDTRARLEQQELHWLTENSDLVILPMTPDALGLDGLLKTVADIREAETAYKVLVNITPPPPSRDGEETKVFLKERGIPVFSRAVRRYVAYQKAALAGVPVFRVKDPRARRAWRDYQAIGREVLNGG